MANASLTDEIMGLEKAFWEAMRSKDAAVAAAMTAPQCVVAGASGTAVIDPAVMGQMLSGATWTLESYAFESPTVQMLDDDTAIVAYKATEQLTVDGKPLTLTAFDTSVWRRDGGRWLCALHTESLAGDPFGRDRGGVSA